MGLPLKSAISFFLLYLRRKGEVERLKRFLRLEYEEQKNIFVENLRRAVRETPFVRRNYPELLSVSEPEDLLDVGVSPDYPPPSAFAGLQRYILLEVYTGGTTGKRKRVFLPNTPFSLRMFADSILLLNAMVYLDSEGEALFRKALGIYEPGLASERFGRFFLKLSTRKSVWVSREEASRVGIKKLVEKGLKSGADVLLGEMPVLLPMLEAVKNLYESGWKPEREIIVLAGGDNPAPALKIVRELREGGLSIRLFNMYGATEALFIGASEFLGETKYSVDDDSVFLIPYTTMSLLGDGKKLYFPENAERGKPYSLHTTVALAFSVPNYDLGDSVVPLGGSRVFVVGRKLVKVSDYTPIGSFPAYYGRVVRLAGIVIWDEVVDVASRALGVDPERTAVFLKQSGGSVIMYILNPDITRELREGELIELLEKHLRETKMEYLIRDMKDGLLYPVATSMSGVEDFVRRVKRSHPEVKRNMFVVLGEGEGE